MPPKAAESGPQVGDFEVAISGGFWVAAGVPAIKLTVRAGWELLPSTCVEHFAKRFSIRRIEHLTQVLLRQVANLHLLGKILDLKL